MFSAYPQKEIKKNPAEELDKLKEELNKSELFLKGLEFLHQYPTMELYRLFVDGVLLKKENGPKGYEGREPGSLNKCFLGFASQLYRMWKDEPELSIDGIKKVHKTVAEKADIYKVAQEKGLDIKAGEFRNLNTESRFVIHKKLASIAGITELFDLMEQEKSDQGCEFSPIQRDKDTHKWVKLQVFSGQTLSRLKDKYSKSSNQGLAELVYSVMAKDNDEAYAYFKGEQTNRPPFAYYAPGDAVINERMMTITASYYSEIAKTTNDDEKIYVIVKHIKQYALLHPFYDANGRTFLNIMLNALLVKHGMKPVTFYEPNVFEAHSVEEIVKIVKEGMESTQKIIDGENLFDFNTASLETTDKKLYKYLKKSSNILADNIGSAKQLLEEKIDGIRAQIDEIEKKQNTGMNLT